jgi:hypothetical protein
MNSQISPFGFPMSVEVQVQTVIHFEGLISGIEDLRVLVSKYYQVSGTLFQKHFFMLYGEKAG